MWDVRASAAFWSTVRPFREKYPEREYIEIIRTVREAIEELRREGRVVETGWSEHRLAKSPFDDGNHFEFHIHDAAHTRMIDLLQGHGLAPQALARRDIGLEVGVVQGRGRRAGACH